MLAGPLPGIYDLTGASRILFVFFAAMAETDRKNIREATLGRPERRLPQGKPRRPPTGDH
jgi:DNA invertase Pin-like site-specific DNA recombinase